jgi:hypothetical protein
MSNDILASLLIRISADTAKFGEGLNRATGQLSSFTSQISKMAGQVGLAFGAFQAFSIVKSAVDSIADFEHEMQTVKAITGATGKEFQALKKDALALGASTKFTAKEVAGLQVEYGRLGFTTKEILAATSATLDLATATGEDLSKAADVAGSTVRGFGLGAEETRRVVDVMAESFNKSALGLENFSEAMKYVAPVASQAGLSVEETTALLGTLADAGIRGSMAGTSLRKIISDLGGESGTLAEKLQKLADKGLTGADAMSEVGRTAYASLLILANNTKKTAELTQELNYAAGAGKEAAKIMGDDLTGDLTKLSSAYDALIQSAGSGTGVIREVTQSLTQLLTALNSGEGALGRFISKWAELALIVPRTLLGAAEGIAEMSSGINATNAALREQEEKTVRIAANVKAAFANGTDYVFDYIESLKGVPDEYEIILAILEKYYATINKVNEEALKPQIGIIAGIEEQLKTLEEAKKNAFSEGEIIRFNEQIKNLRSELEALNAARPLSNFGKEQLANARNGITTNVEDQSTDAPELNPLNENLQIQDPLIEVREGIQLTTEQWQDYYATVGDLRAQEQQEYADNAQAAMQYGEVVGSALSDVISGQKTFMQAMRQVTGELVKMFFQRAIAGIISSSTQTPGPPPVVLAAAAAGIAVISGLFSKIGAGGGRVSTGGSLGRSAASGASSAGMKNGAQDSNPTIKFVLRGQDIWGALQNFENSNGYLKPSNG